MCKRSPAASLPAATAVAIAIALALAAATLLGGCVSRHSALSTRFAPAPAAGAADATAAIAWPDRDEAWADRVVHEEPLDVDWFVRRDGTVTDGKAELGERHGSLRLMGSVGRVEFTRRVGVGVVREVRRGREEDLSEDARENSFRRFTAFTSRLPGGECLVDDGYFSALTGGSRSRLARRTRFLARAGLRPIDRELQLALNQGMPIYLDPAWVHTEGFRRPSAEEAPTRGIFVVLEGLGPVERDDRALYDELAGRGWRVVLIPTAMLSAMPARPVAIASNTPEAIDVAGVALAELVDDRLAEMAYVVEAAAAHLSERHPEMADKPIVVYGYSGGAFAAPAAAARLRERLPGRLAGMVLVCGGSNIMDIALRSVVADSDRIIHWEEGAPFFGSRKISDAYLRHSRLDPAVLGPRLTDVPTLMVKAKIDWAVPGSATDRLYYDLGRPDWWSYLAGHMSVLDRLAGDRVAFADWLDGALERGSGVGVGAVTAP